MTQEAAQARRNYNREYRKKNRDKLVEYQRKWYANNQEKRREMQARYWEKKAANAEGDRA